MKIKVFEDGDALSSYAAEHIVSIVTSAVHARGYASVALSGGSTPKPTYTLLAGDQRIDRNNWRQVHIFWGDERCVPPDHPESNFLMVSEVLLDHVPIPERNVHRIKGELPPQQVAAEYESELRSFFSENTRPQFDLILLGLGEDAHTASLFPGTEAMHSQNTWVEANFVPKLGDWRITITPLVINAASQVTFLVVGEQKAESVRRVMQAPYNPDLYPAQIVNPRGGRLLWLIDRGAASLIPVEEG